MRRGCAAPEPGLIRHGSLHNRAAGRGTHRAHCRGWKTGRDPPLGVSHTALRLQSPAIATWSCFGPRNRKGGENGERGMCGVSEGQLGRRAGQAPPQGRNPERKGLQLAISLLRASVCRGRSRDCCPSRAPVSPGRIAPSPGKGSGAAPARMSRVPQALERCSPIPGGETGP